MGEDYRELDDPVERPVPESIDAGESLRANRGLKDAGVNPGQALAPDGTTTQVIVVLVKWLRLDPRTPRAS